MLVVAVNKGEVEEKLAKETGKSFHIVLPTVLIHFMAGLFLSLLQRAIWKGKGCICVDCTNGVHDCGLPNQLIPSQMTIYWAFFYKTALNWLLVAIIWQLQITKP